MSNIQNTGMQRKKKYFLVPQVNDALILMGWVAALILVAALCWFFTQPVRSRFLQKSVNRVLEQSGDSRRLGEPLGSGAQKAGSFGFGTWYAVIEGPSGPSGTAPGEQGTKVLVFSFIAEGTFFPCAAVTTAEGKVLDFIPLNSHGERIMKRISPGVLKIYARRIEGIES